MKKRILATLGLLSVLGGSLAFMTACGNDADVKSLSEKLDTSIAAVQESSYFTNKTYKIKGENYSFYAPNYYSTMEARVKDQTEVVTGTSLDSNDSSLFVKQKTNHTSYERIGMNYDIPFGYAFNAILRCNSIIKNNYENLNKASSAVSSLISSLDNFTQATKDYELVIKRTNSYWGNVSTISSDLAENALYNYMKDYEGYVRTSINLARELYSAVEDLCPMVNYKEQTRTQLSTTQSVTLQKIAVSQGTKLNILSIDGEKTKTYNFSYTDKNNIVWNFSEDGDYKDAKAGDTVALDKDVEVAAAYIGRNVTRNSKVQIIEKTSEKFFKVQYVDAEGVLWTRDLAIDGKYVNGNIELNKEVTMAKDAVFDLYGKRVDEKTEIKKLGVQFGSSQAIYLEDSHGYRWEGTVDVSKIAVVPATETDPETYWIKERTVLQFKDLMLAKNTVVDILSDDGITVEISYKDENGYVWGMTTGTSVKTNSEKSLYEKMALETLDEYYTFNIEKMNSKAYTDEEYTLVGSSNEIKDTMRWVNNYIEFMKSAAVQQKASVLKKLSTEDISAFNAAREIYEVNKNLNRETLNKLNLTNIRFFVNWEMNKDEKLNFEKLQTYYNDLLVSWVNYYTSTL